MCSKQKRKITVVGGEDEINFGLSDASSSTTLSILIIGVDMIPNIHECIFL